MKSIKSIFTLALLAIFIFTSCDNEPLTGDFTDESGGIVDTTGSTGSGATGSGSGSGGTGLVIPENSFGVKVNGVPFISFLNTCTNNFGGIIVQGIDLGNNSLSITVPEDVVPGSYVVDDIDYKGAYINPSPLVYSSGYTGSILILSHDTVAKKISGTFNFIATPNAPPSPDFVVTDGTFNLTYN